MLIIGPKLTIDRLVQLQSPQPANTVKMNLEIEYSIKTYSRDSVLYLLIGEIIV